MHLCLAPGHLDQERQAGPLHKLRQPAGHVRCVGPQCSLQASPDHWGLAWQPAPLWYALN